MRGAQVDCTANEQVCARFDVHRYPTMLVLDKGSMYPYTGPPEKDDIVAFALVRLPLA